MTDIRNELFSKADPGYRAFTAKLTPTVPPESIIGVRVPLLRAFARKLTKEEPETVRAFLAVLPHAYYEENGLHAYLLAQMRAFSACVQAVDAFLPYVDNWAVCDGL